MDEQEKKFLEIFHIAGKEMFKKALARAKYEKLCEEEKELLATIEKDEQEIAEFQQKIDEIKKIKASKDKSVLHSTAFTSSNDRGLFGDDTVMSAIDAKEPRNDLQLSPGPSATVFDHNSLELTCMAPDESSPDDRFRFVNPRSGRRTRAIAAKKAQEDESE